MRHSSTFAHFQRSLLRCAAAVGLALVIGCNPPPRPGMSEISATAKSVEPQLDSASQSPADTLDAAISIHKIELPWETWHAYFIGSKKVGYTHVSSAVDDEGDGEDVLTTIVDHVKMRRGSSTFVQSLQQSSRETRDGALISFEADLRVGPLRTRFEGRVTNQSLKVATIRGTAKADESMPWSDGYYGFAGVQQTLLASPLRQDQSRRIQVMVPILNRPATVELKAVGRASISTMDGGAHDALEVDVRTGLAEGAVIESTIWIDDAGNLLKSYTPSLDLTSIRSSKEYALEAIPNPAELLSQTSITVKGTLSKPEEAYRVGYVLSPKRIKDASPADFSIEPQVGQWFRKRDDGALQLLVSRDPKEPDREGFVSVKMLPEPADSQSGPLIDSASAEVRKLAVLSKATQPRDLALDLTRTVKQLIGPGDYSRGFATASRTARDSVGDCTERAVLLAAMLRAREVPARIAAGLVYTGSDQGASMAYHMWTLAWIDDHWLALDPTQGRLAAADRIILATSHLADGNEYNCLAPVLAAIGRMDIEISNAKYRPLD
ncbi:MAG: transglutaminase-like domain-containing protein [Planctomycetaceae bacterium]